MTFKRGDLVTVPPGKYRGTMAGFERQIFCDVPGTIYNIPGIKYTVDLDKEMLVSIADYGNYRVPIKKLKRRTEIINFEF